MVDTEKDQALTTPKADRKKKSSSSKAAADGAEATGEKKRKAPKAPVADAPPEYEQVHESKIEPTAADQEVPAKPKKKRTPKVELTAESNEAAEAAAPVKKKKSKAPKIAPADDEYQINDPTSVDDMGAYVEPKIKTRKSKKSKQVIVPDIDTFEEIEVTNLDDYNPEMGEAMPEMYPEEMQMPEGAGPSELQQTISDSFNNLAAKMNFGLYVGDDVWNVTHLPKSGRTEPKSRIRKIFPGGKDENKPNGKPGLPKPKLFSRFRSGVTTMVRDPNNLLFGDQPTHMLNDEDMEEDDVDTDNLHRYAQKLRELEDQDREVNPEFLILQDGKTVYGVHEADTDGKVKLSKRKPIYDRNADQKPDEVAEKKKLLARLKAPFSRNKDSKDGKPSTPDSRSPRKSSRKSNIDESMAMPDDYAG